MTVTNEFVARIKTKWLQHAPQLWWGDRLDARFLVTDAIHSLAGVRVLDIGCNAGVMLSEIPGDNQRFGLERSPSAMQLARKLNPSVPIVNGDMLALPFGDASVDVVLLCGMLEIPSHDQKSDAVGEAARVLKPGGRLYLTTLNRRYLRYRHAWPMLPVTLEELRALLEPHFDVDIKGFNPLPPFPYFLPNRILARVPGIWPLLIWLMNAKIGLKHSCMFVADAVKKRNTRRVR
jgi:SAM-dependent methyltransferase